MVELASVGDPASVPAAIATVLGITPQGDAPLIDTRRRGAAGPAAARSWSTTASTSSTRSRSRHAADPRSVATSRSSPRRARPSGRRRERVSSLPLALEGGASSDAVTLFVDRARAVAARLRASRSRRPRRPWSRSARRLDGLPLGIELAAARMAAMSPVEVRDRLGRSIPAAAGRRTTGPERQLTLRHAVAWSYDLLDRRRARRCSARTSVFAGGFDLASVAAVRRRRRRRRRARHSRLAGPQVARRRRPHRRRAPGTACSRRSASSPRTGWRRRARSSRRVTGTPSTSPARRPRAGSTGTARVARRRRLGGGRARQPPCRLPVERGHEASSRSRPTSRRMPR